jgi:hypothetical protein
MWFTMQRTYLALILAAALPLAAAIAQTPTDPPPAQKPILTVTGKGVQIYICQKTPTGVQWVFQSPEADLFDAAGNKVGTHAAGPVWRSDDGSSVTGELIQKSPSPDPTAIPWLLLRASSTSSLGILSIVEFIRRSDTHGGIAPATGCSKHHKAAVSRVPYTATYTFYSARP